MGRFLKARAVTRRAGKLIPEIDDPAPDTDMAILITNGREVMALPTPAAPLPPEN